MSESAPNPHNIRLAKLTGAHFDIVQSNDKGGWVFTQKPNDEITKDQQRLLDDLDNEGLLLGEQQRDGDKTKIVVPAGTVPINDLSNSFGSEWADQITHATEAAHTVTGIPVDRLQQYVVLENLPEAGRLAVKIAPSFIDELDTGRQIGGTVLNRHLE